MNDSAHAAPMHALETAAPPAAAVVHDVQAIRAFLINEPDTVLVALDPESGLSKHHRGANAEWAVRQNAHRMNIYYTPNVAKPGVTMKPKNVDIAQVRAVYADVDAKDRRTIPECEAAIAGLPLPPTRLVMTGGGVQGVWVLDAPVGPDDFARVRAINETLADTCDGDHIQDVSRILRLPGTVNWPTAAKRARGRVPTLAYVLSESGRRYTLEELEAAFPSSPGLAPASVSTGTAFTLPSAFSDPAFIKPEVLDVIDPRWGAARFSDGIGIPLDELEAMTMSIARAGGMARYDAGWSRVGMALGRTAFRRPHEAEAIYAVLDAASRVAGGNYDAVENRRHFDRFVREAATKDGGDDRTILRLAVDAGWRDPRTLAAASSPAAQGSGPVGVADLPAVPSKREWLHGTDIMRGAVTMVVAPGGRGKSAWLIGTGLACTTGRSLMGSYVFAPPRCGLRVLYINNEDGTDEIGRRVRAAIQRHGLTGAEFAGLMVAGVDRLRLTLLRADRGSAQAVEAGWRALEQLIEEHRPDVLILDPLANLSAASLNDNHAATMLMASLTALAVKHRLGIVVAHHTAKGRDVSSQEAASGAAAIVNSARISLALEPLAEADAMNVNVLPSEAWRYFSLGQAKGNLAPPGARRMFRLESVELGNAQPPIYPHGDSVQVAVPFTPNPVADPFPPEVTRAALEAIVQADPPLSPSARAKGRHAVPAVVAAISPHLPAGDVLRAEATAVGIIDRLVRDGRIQVVQWRAPKAGRGTNPVQAYAVVAEPAEPD